VQMGLYLLGAAIAVAVIQSQVPGGWTEVLESARAAGKLQVLEFSWSLAAPYTFLAGLVGGAVFTMASHGTDQIIVQRLLTCRGLRDSQKALIGSGFAVVGQFLLFLLVGIGLWSFYAGQAFDSTDEIFARFIIDELPAGVTGLLIACVFAAAMSSLSSSVNALASSTAYDYWAPLVGASDDEQRILKAGKVFTLGWGALLAVGAVMFIPLSRHTSAVEVALGVAAVVYGVLLGAFALGVLKRSTSQPGVIAGMGLGIAAIVAMQGLVAWPWYVPVGATITLAVGLASQRVVRSNR
ncbi:MAG: hypothetical protein F4173_12260, partial [Acidobacteriia bacterium]|nr:hypothetical protein [Terriglobia bacterium]